MSEAKIVRETESERERERPEKREREWGKCTEKERKLERVR